MDKQRDALADALYKKGLALIQLEEDQETIKVIVPLKSSRKYFFDILCHGAFHYHPLGHVDTQKNSQLLDAHTSGVLWSSM